MVVVLVAESLLVYDIQSCNFGAEIDQTTQAMQVKFNKIVRVEVGFLKNLGSIQLEQGGGCGT